MGLQVEPRHRVEAGRERSPHELRDGFPSLKQVVQKVGAPLGAISAELWAIAHPVLEGANRR